MTLSNAFGVQCKIYLCTAENWQTLKAQDLGRDRALLGRRRS